MNGLCITDAVKQFGITSKTLRYYERVGLLESKRAGNNNYRYYDESDVERIKQIMILRKMQISIKDIIRIYENDDMNTVVEVFVNRINMINEEIGALSELKRITNDFLQVMHKNGVTKISALPILYEQAEKQLDVLDKHKKTDFTELSSLSDKLVKPTPPSILFLSPMRVLSSVRKGGISDPDGFWRWVQAKAISQGDPGQHQRFEFQTNEGDVFILKISNDFINDGEYSDYIFSGGLFAVVNVYLDEDLGACLRSLIQFFDDNKYYQIDYLSDGNLRHAAMIENLISSDSQRELVSLLVPVKKRLADPALFDKPIEVNNITTAEIEAANPVLWTTTVELDKLTPINNPHYRLTDEGEVEYIGWILTRVLNTNTAVKLPFRVDIEFRTGEYHGFGANDESLRIYHGNHGLDHNYGFEINMGNSTATQSFDSAISFHQPIFRNAFNFPERGKIVRGEYNQLTWIIGEKHLACIINGEVRYCGTNFPYMSLDLSREEAHTIVIGSERTKFIRSIHVSQIVETQKNKLNRGELIMSTKQSNNIIPIIHRLITDEYGENYWFNGCARYVMEALGEYKADSDLMTDEIENETAIISDLGYWLFSGLTGDIFTHFYPRNHVYRGEAISCMRMSAGDTEFVESVFAKCGYAATYVLGQDLIKNKEMYKQTLMAYIDKGIPVIAWGPRTGSHTTAIVGMYVGYEEYGKTFLYITGNKNEPERISFDAALSYDPECLDKQHALESVIDILLPDGGGLQGGWVFVGEKIQTRPIADIYREALQGIHAIMTKKSDTFAYGPEALYAWADTIESGWFEGMTPDKFDDWGMHTNFVCVLATNGSCIHNFLWRAKTLNPDMTFLDDVCELYERTEGICSNDNGEDLEAIGGGFNVTLETLQDKEKCKKIAAKIREAAVCMDEVVQILQREYNIKNE